MSKCDFTEEERLGYTLCKLNYEIRMFKRHSDNDVHDYGDGLKHTELEAHMLSYIDEHPNCTASDIARDWGRTPGAVSLVLKRLRDDGQISKTTDPNNERKILLNITEKGKALDQLHRAYDNEKRHKRVEYLLENHSPAEIQTAIDVLQTYLYHIRNIQED